jgi:FkbM family methyltransferase
MEKELGWTGLAVEPHPAVFDVLRKNRTCALFHVCVGAANGSVRFRAVEGAASAMSGIEDAYNDRTLRRIERSGKHSDFIDVESVTLKDLLRRFGIDHVDFLVDRHGGQRVTISSRPFDFSVPIRAITVENNMHTVRRSGVCSNATASPSRPRSSATGRLSAEGSEAPSVLFLPA